MKYIAQPQFNNNTVDIYEFPLSSTPKFTLGTFPNSPNSALVYQDSSGVSKAFYLFIAFIGPGNNGSVSVYDLGAILSASPSGTPPTALQGPLVLTDNPVGMAIQPGTGDLYVATHGDNGNASVVVYARTPGTTTKPDTWETIGTVLLSDDNSGGIAGVVANVAFDLHGNLWLTTFDADGQFLCCFPTPPSPGNFLKLTNGAQLPTNLIAPILGFQTPPSVAPQLFPFSSPEGIAFDPAGNLWLGNNNDDFAGGSLAIVNPQFGGGGGGSFLMVSGPSLQTLLYSPSAAATSARLQAAKTGLAVDQLPVVPGAPPPVTTYYINNASQFGGLCFDGYTLYITDENNFGEVGTTGDFEPVVWQCNTRPVVDPTYPGYPKIADFEKSFAASGVVTTNSGNGSMTIVNYPYPNPTLTIRDIGGASGDVGHQPDSAVPGGASGTLWQSPDILVSNSINPPAGVTYGSAVLLSTNPSTPSFSTSGTVEPGSPAYISVRVTNFGSTASTGTEILKIYYGLASTGLDWPAPWDGSAYYNGQANLPLGGVIGETQLPIIPPASEMYVQIVWPANEIPNPLDYLAAAGGSIGEAGHFCLLARIETTSVYPFGMCFPEEVGPLTTPTALHDNVLNNSAIGWRNIAIVNVSTGGETFGPEFRLRVLGANYGAEGRLFSFGIQTIGRGGEVEPIRGKVVVRAEGKALERLLATQFEQHRCRFLGEGLFHLLDRERGMSKIHLPARELLPFTVEFTPEEDVRDFAINVIQYLHVDGVEKVFGGQMFVVGEVKGIHKRWW